MNAELHVNLSKINEHLAELRQKFYVARIGIFGSVAKGDMRPESDVDILVEFSEPVGFFKFLELENFLSKILGKKVDLVTKRALKPLIKDRVLDEVVYA